VAQGGGILMINFKIRETQTTEPGMYALTISDTLNTVMDLYLFTGDIVRLQKALKEAGF
jgi:hypothetical protein